MSVAADPLPAERRRRMVFVTLLAASVTFLDVTIVNVAFPSITHSFPGTSLPTLSWTLNAYNVVFAALLIPAGRYADALGHRRAFVSSMVLFVVASSAAGAAPSAGFLIAARVVQAAAAATLVPTSLALLLSVFTLERRPIAVAYWGAAAGVAGAAGPTLGGALVSASNWRLVFFVNIPVGVLAVWLARSLRERAGEREAALPEPVGLVLVAVAVGLLALGIVEGHDWGWASAGVLASFAGSAALTAAFFARVTRGRGGTLDLAAFNNRSFSLGNVGTLLFAAAFYGVLLNNVLLLTGVWRYSTLGAGLALTPAPLLAAATAVPAGRIAERFGHRTVVVPGLLLYACGTAYLAAAVGAHPSYVDEFLPGAAIGGIGVGLGFPALASAAVHTVGAGNLGTGSAINSAARQVGAVIGIAVVVAILSSQAATDPLGAHETAWIFATIAAAAVIPFGALLPRAAVAALGAELAAAPPPAGEPRGESLSQHVT